MKTHAFLSGVVAFLAATVLSPFLNSLQAEIIGVEPFSYPDGVIANRNGGTFWDFKNVAPTAHTGTASTWDNLSNAPAVAAARLLTNNSSAKREYNGANETQGAVNETNVNRAVYYRVTVTTGAILPDFFVLSSYDGSTERVYFGKPFGQPNFGLGVGSGPDTTTGPAVQANTTYTLVTRLDFVANTIRLYVNPDLAAPESAAIPVASATYTASFPSTALRVSSGFAGDPVAWDDLVVATSWDDLKTVVTTVADEDNGSLGGGTGISLREAVKYSPAGHLITFAPALNWKICTLSLGEMSIDKSLTIDGSALANGLTIDANGTSRIFLLSGSTASLTLSDLTLTGASSDGDGGAIYNGGMLNLRRCTFFGNRAGNSGGAVINAGQTIATHSTFSGNTAAVAGAAFYNSPGNSLTLRHCTVVGNTAIGNSGGGLLSFGTLTLENTIIAGNRGAFNPDVAYGEGTITRLGANLIGRNDSAETTFPVGSPNAQGDYVGTAAAPLDPKLTPLGFFGGPTQTLHPLIGSPAIDTAGTANPGGTDQRGFARFVDGNASFSSQLDIGAVEAGAILSVTTAVDENNGPTSGAGVSLREILATNPSAGARIGFSSNQFPATITLTQGELSIPGTVNGLFIDASNLTSSVTISGNNASRVFNIPASATVALHNLAIINGRAPDGAPASGGAGQGGKGGNGGGILNAGSLSLFSCAVQFNRSGKGADDSAGGAGGFGGGIFNSGALRLTDCTLFSNQAGDGGLSRFDAGANGGSGGGIASNGSLDLTGCTFASNEAGNGGNGVDFSATLGLGGDGGGIFSNGSLSLTLSTLFGNFSGDGGARTNGVGGNGGSGGGIYKNDAIPYRIVACTIASNATGNPGNGTSSGSEFGRGGGIAGGQAILQHSLIAQNTGLNASDQVNVSALTFLQANLLGSPATSATTATGPAPIIAFSPLLAPLGDYGGPTPTVALKPGSPARNAATLSEVQQINIGAFPIAFALTYFGQTTGLLNQDSTGAQVEAALSALSNIGAGNVSVTRTTDAGSNTRFVVTFTGALAIGDRFQITANNGATVSTISNGSVPRPSDQRGFPIVGLPDLGAYEAGTITNYNNFIYETLPATATDAQHAATFDFDGDGANNQAEYIAGTGVTDLASVFRVLTVNRTNDFFSISYPTVVGRKYTLDFSADLTAWQPITDLGPGNGNTVLLNIGYSGRSKGFVRVRVGF